MMLAFYLSLAATAGIVGLSIAAMILDRRTPRGED